MIVVLRAARNTLVARCGIYPYLLHLKVSAAVVQELSATTGLGTTLDLKDLMASNRRPATASAEAAVALPDGTAPACRVCGSGRTSLYGVHSGYALIRCDDCSLVFSLEEPDLPRIEEFYSADYFTGGTVEYADYLAEAPAHRSQGRRYLDMFRKMGIGGSSLFDVGCASGFFLDEARRAGWSVAGCDVSDVAARYAQETLGLAVTKGDFLCATRDTNASYDVVTCLNVFEHLPAPRLVADRLLSLVKPGGHLILETWDHQSLVARLLGHRWHQWAPPFVPYYYNRTSLEKLFAPDKWRLVHYRSFGKRVSLGRALTAFRARYVPGLPGAALQRLATSRVGALHLTYALGDLVLVVFQRL